MFSITSNLTNSLSLFLLFDFLHNYISFFLSQSPFYTLLFITFLFFVFISSSSTSLLIYLSSTTHFLFISFLPLIPPHLPSLYFPLFLYFSCLSSFLFLVLLLFFSSFLLLFFLNSLLLSFLSPPVSLVFLFISSVSFYLYKFKKY